MILKEIISLKIQDFYVVEVFFATKKFDNESDS